MNNLIVKNINENLSPELAKQYLEEIDDFGFRSFSLEMKKSYAFANKENLWSEQSLDAKSLKIKLSGMYEELKHIPIRAYPDLFKRAREDMSKMDIPMNIPNVVTLLKAWYGIKVSWHKHEREILQDLTRLQIEKTSKDMESRKVCFDELHKMGIFRR